MRNRIVLGPQVRVDESVVETQRRESKAAAAGEKHGVERLLSLGIGNQGMDSGYKIDDHGKGLHKSVDQVQVSLLLTYYYYKFDYGTHLFCLCVQRFLELWKIPIFYFSEKTRKTTACVRLGKCIRLWSQK